MNNSDQPLAPEEKWTAYFDDRLEASESSSFEQEHPHAPGEKMAVSRITRALRTHSAAPILQNPEFFNTSVLSQIVQRAPRAENPPGRIPFWTLWRMALASACCLAAAFAIYSTFVRDQYNVTVLSAKAGDRQLSASVLNADGLTVVWIAGLEPLPNDYVLQ